MAKEYIEKEAARRMLSENTHRVTVADEHGFTRTVKWSERVIYAEVADNVIAALPAADVRENVKGEWELHGGDDDLGGYYFCSNCYAGYDEDWFYVHDEYHPFAHCPCCGAQMGGAEDGK